MSNIVAILLIAALILGPWLIGKLVGTAFSSVNRHIGQQISPSQRRGNAALGRVTEFTIKDVNPSEVIEAIVSDTNQLGAGPRWVGASTYIAHADDDYVIFRFGKQMGSGWDAMLAVEPAGSGVEGQYGVMEATEHDGLLWGTKQMAELEHLVLTTLKRHFPTISIQTSTSDGSL